MRRSHGNEEGGLATIELALTMGMLLLLALGAFEYGMFFGQAQDVAAASREGARTAASAGDAPTADCLVLEAASGALFGTTGGTVAQITIRKANVSGAPLQQRFRPSVAADDPLLLECSGGWFKIENNWPAASRDDEGVDRDWVEVRIDYEHDWITNFLWFSGSTQFAEETTMHMPPNG